MLLQGFQVFSKQFIGMDALCPTGIIQDNNQAGNRIFFLKNIFAPKANAEIPFFKPIVL